MRKIKKLLAALSVTFAMAIGVLGTGAAISSYAAEAETGTAEEFTITSVELAKKMGRGINLGNTMEATNTWTTNPTIKDFETAWQPYVTTKEMITGMKEAGFDTLRIPVSWINGMYPEDVKSNHTTDKLMALFKEKPDAKISDEFFKRIDEIIGYALDNDMYVILNDHWDYGWWSGFIKDEDTAMKHYVSMWTQIAEHYKDYSEKLILESANEELTAKTQTWDNASTMLGFDKINKINQKFVDVVRKSGGNNDKRYLLIAGVNTDIDRTCNDQFVMPKDTIENHLFISVHFYDPYPYCDMWKDADWASVQYNWGTASDKAAMKTQLDKMKKFTDAGYGVIIGEYGVLPDYDGASKCERKDDDVEYLNYFLGLIKDYGYTPVLWDTGGFFDRKNNAMRFLDIASVFFDTSKLTVSESLGMPALPTLKNVEDGVSVKWKAVSGATGYIVNRKTGAKGTYEKLAYVSGGKTLSYTDKDAAAGKTYYYTIQTVKNDTKSNYNKSGSQILRLDDQKVKNAENVKTGITITWDKVAGAKGYAIYKKTGNGKEKLLKQIKSAKTTKFTDKSVKNGVTYTYKVVAVNGSSKSTATGMSIVRLNAPALKSVASKKSSAFTAKWGKNSKATGYQIKYELGKTYKIVYVNGAKNIKQDISKLSGGKTYKVYVRAYKTTGGKTYFSSWSAAKKCKIKK